MATMQLFQVSRVVESLGPQLCVPGAAGHYIYIYIYIYMYIYIYREREMYIYIYIYIYSSAFQVPPTTLSHHSEIDWGLLFYQ